MYGIMEKYLEVGEVFEQSFVYKGKYLVIIKVLCRLKLW